ncbi:MAG: hypothetical protein OEW53_01250 [Actinomycetota bacterium]|nr:hypothetical protein [Actinomycetota bacterium]
MRARAAVGADLQTLAQRVWTPEGLPDWPVTVSFGHPPPDATLVEQYVVVPDLRRPKFLVPVGARAASRAAFSKYLTTSSVQTRGFGYLSAAGFGTPLGERVFGGRVFVGIDPSIPTAQWPEWLLLEHLRQVLGGNRLVAYLPVRRAVPNAKPTLRLFERTGAPRGYVKVGWSEATRGVVRNEAAALRDVQGRLGLLQAPALAASGSWQGQEYAVAASLPPGVRGWTREPSSTPELLAGIVRSGKTGRAPLATSSFAARVRADLVRAAEREPEVSTALLRWLDRLSARHAELDFGRWHGDYVPGNLGRTPDGPVAWDWEYSDPDVPVGFDLLHWHFQARLSPDDGNLVDSARAVDEEAHRLSCLGVDPRSHGLVASLYLLEMFTRAVRMASAGAGWNRKYQSGLVETANGRDR